jgi:2-hydroxycyclohexanecarboxyl-CoA dehydrogenase
MTEECGVPSARTTLDGKAAVITGGGGGLGSAICAGLAAMGARVVVADVAAERAASVAERLTGAVAMPVDLVDPDDIERFVGKVGKEIGDVEILVNNAGWDKMQPFVESEPTTWDRLIAINLRAPIQLTHAFLPKMLTRGSGRLVYIASDAARVGSSGEAVYAACKGGITAFAKTIAREAARSQVTSNVVCPGPSDTPLLAELAAGNQKLVEALKRAIPLGRLAQPDDIAGMVAFLASEQASYITGQTISVSGGLTMI